MQQCAYYYNLSQRLTQVKNEDFLFKACTIYNNMVKIRRMKYFFFIYLNTPCPLGIH